MLLTSLELKKKYNIDDFTILEYENLLRTAKNNYKFIQYNEIDLYSSFVLWRHDCDSSLNRALRLAEIEHNLDVRATYFINPHSEFYNFLEQSQFRIVKKIIELGHALGLHFDANFYDIESENQLEDLVYVEAEFLRSWFDTDINSFSFHNPTKFHLTCEQYKYGGLINCYSKVLKQNVSYCSDSNGYWRFKRLKEVLEDLNEKKLHILTHPEWWQESAMSPRERIQRSINGRASAILKAYDDFLDKCGRVNVR